MFGNEKSNCCVEPSSSDKIVTVDVGGITLAFPASRLADIASIFIGVKMFKAGDYPNHAQLVEVTDPLTFKLEDGSRFQPVDPKVAALSAKLEQKNTDWYNQYKKAEDLKKELDKANAVINALNTRGECGYANVPGDGNVSVTPAPTPGVS